jgi:hypothetical protein
MLPASPLVAGPLLAAGRLLARQQPPVQDPDDVREAADEVLSRPEFGEAPTTLLQRIGDWIADLFGDPPSRTVETRAGSGGSGLLTLLLLLLLVVLLVLVVRALIRQPRLRRTDADPEPTIEVTEHHDAAAWSRAAVDHEAAGDWREALRCRFRALLEQLVERGVVDEVPGRTTGELRLEVADRAPAAAGDFAEVADLFDAAWYGEADTGPDDVRRLLDHADRVLAATERELVAP